MVLSSKDFVSPAELVATTAAFFGGQIELDPASSKHANTIVQAEKYFTWEDNGLKQSWKANNIYLYPPRDILLKHEQPKPTKLFQVNHQFKKSSQRVWLELAYDKWLRDEFNEGILFITSVEVALIVTQKIQFDFPMCVLKDKPQLFVDNEKLDKVKNTKVIGFVYYLPSKNNIENSIKNFYEFYSTLGRVYT